MKSDNNHMNNCEANYSSVPPLVGARNTMVINALRVLAACLTLLIYAMLSLDLATNSQGLSAYSLLLLGYLYAEAKNLRAREPYLFWINPVVLASIFTFVTAFGITNIIYFMPENLLAGLGIEPIVTPWMNQVMLLVMLGAVAMWVGYNSGTGSNLGEKLQRSRLLRKWMLPSMHVKKDALYSFIAISLIAKFWSIKLGVFGYSSTYDQLIAAANYTQYFAMADSLGNLALVAVAMQYFAAQRSTLTEKHLFWLVLGLTVAFGFLSGFKSAVVMPFIIVGIVCYTQQNRFPRWLVPAVVVSIIAAYAMIEPFRAARNDNQNFDKTSIFSIVSTMAGAPNINSDYEADNAGVVMSFLARSNLTYIASLGIEYAANNKLPPDSPAFLDDIIYAPVYAFVPRFLWEGKSLQNIGLWYTNEVMGFDFLSSTAMSPFIYLNFVGGPLAVIVGFLIVGILQRGLFDGLRHFGGGGLIVLLGLLSTLTMIDSAFNSFFVSIIRFLPMLVIVQHVLLRRSRS